MNDPMKQVHREQALVALEALQAEGDPAASLAVIALCGASCNELASTLADAVRGLTVHEVWKLLEEAKVVMSPENGGDDSIIVRNSQGFWIGSVDQVRHSRAWRWTIYTDAGPSQNVCGVYESGELNRAIGRMYHELSGLGWKVPPYDNFDFAAPLHSVVDGKAVRREVPMREVDFLVR